jgi:hypothetical protein
MNSRARKIACMGLGVFAAGWLLAAGCKTSSSGDDALKALGSTTPAPQYGEDFWREQRAAGGAAWRRAKRICAESLLSTYPNCLPVIDLAKTDQGKAAAAADQSNAHFNEMNERGFTYDSVRGLYFRDSDMVSRRCHYTLLSPNSTTDLRGTFECPPGAKLPQGEK